MTSEKPLVLLDTPVSDNPENGVSERAQSMLREHFQLLWIKELEVKPELSSKVAGIFVYGNARRLSGFLHANISSFTSLRVVSSHSAGLDYLDLELMKAHNIRVGYIPQITAPVTADMALTLMCSVARLVKQGMRLLHEPARRSNVLNYPYGVDVYGATLGIVGLGRIGSEVAKRAKAFDMTVLYHNRRRREKEEKELGCSYLGNLEDLLKHSDFIVLCCPLTAETRQLIGADQLKLMKQKAVLINVGRGPLVDTGALTDALTRGALFGAGLDVTDPEPLPADHPLLSLDNCIVMPHWGSQTEGTRRKMADQTVKNLINGVNGEAMEREYQFES